MGKTVAFVLIAAVTGLAVSACRSRPTPEPKPTQEERPALAPVVAGEPRPTVLEAPPEQMRLALANAYRLKPDARFLGAIREVHRFFTGQPYGPVTAEFVDGRWQLSYQYRPVGTVPEFPDFSDFKEVLAAWVRQLHQEHPLNVTADTAEPSKAFFAPEQFATLRENNQQWAKGERRAGVVQSAARATIMLAAQSLDHAETADLVPARALALLSLASQLTGEKMEHEECLLAWVMGYARHSQTVAARLPATDAVRWYVLRDARLLKAADGPEAPSSASAPAVQAPAETRYLILLRLAEYRDLQRWLETANKLFPGPRLPPAVASTAFQLGRFDAGRIATFLSVPTTLEEMRASPDPGELKGPFLDQELYERYYLGYFRSVDAVAGLHFLDSLSSVQTVQEFSELLNQEQNDRQGLAEWYSHLAQSKDGNTNLQLLLEDLRAPEVGGALLERTFQELSERAPHGDPLLWVAARRMAERLDTRIEHRLALARIAYFPLNDQPLAGRLYRSALDSASADHPWIWSWFATVTKDTRLLKQIMRAPELTPLERAGVVAALEELNALSAQEVRAEYARLMGEAGDTWDIAERLVSYLERNKKYAEARVITEGWLAKHAEDDGLEPVFAKTALARLHQQEGHGQQAWAIVEPLIASQQAGAMQRAALIMESLGRADEARSLVDAAMARYPDLLYLRACLAQMLWRRGAYAEAAGVLKEFRPKIAVTEWQFEIAPAFQEVFAGRSLEEHVVAFTALIAAGHDPFFLQPLASAVAKAGQAEAAFRMVSQLRAAGIAQLTFIFDAYRYRKQWQGERAAVEWIRGALPPAALPPASMFAFQEGEYGLLWDLVGDPGQGEAAEFVWLLRAAASLKMKPARDSHAADLRSYYEQSAQASYYSTIARHLLGLAAEADVLALAADGKKRCEIAYYLAVKAQGEGREQDASEWYRVAVETGLDRNGEYRWAYNTLYTWREGGKLLK